MAQDPDQDRDPGAQQTLLNALDSIKRLLEESERKNPLLQRVVAQVEESHIPVLEDIVFPEHEALVEDEAELLAEEEDLFEVEEFAGTDAETETETDTETTPETATDADADADRRLDHELAAQASAPSGLDVETLRVALDVVREDLERQIEQRMNDTTQALKTELAANLDALFEELTAPESDHD